MDPQSPGWDCSCCPHGPGDTSWESRQACRGEVRGALLPSPGRSIGDNLPSRVDVPFLCQPLDVLKTRLMNAKGGTGEWASRPAAGR